MSGQSLGMDSDASYDPASVDMPPMPTIRQARTA